MKIFHKLNKFIGFHIFAFNGWFSLSMIYWLYSIYKEEQKFQATGTTLGFYASIAFFLVLGIFSLSIFVGILEYIFNHQINKKFFLNNKFYCVFEIIGILLMLLVAVSFLILFVF